MRRIGQLFADDRGASIVEMALAAPLLATMLVGMVDLSRGYSAKLQLEQAAQRTIERVQVSEFKETDKPSLKAEAEAAAGTGSSATVDAWLECNGTRQGSYAATCSAGQIYARYVTVVVAQDYTPIFPIGWGTPNANGSYTLRGRAGVRVQ